MSTYEPGTVAMSAYGRVFMTEQGWYFDDGSGGPTTEEVPPAGLRPLLVFDPEDVQPWRELVQGAHLHRPGEMITDTVESLRRSARQLVLDRARVRATDPPCRTSGGAELSRATRGR